MDEEPIEISESGGDTAEEYDADPSADAGDNEARLKRRGKRKRGTIRFKPDSTPAPHPAPPGFPGFQLSSSWRPIMYTGPPPRGPVQLGRMPGPGGIFGAPVAPRPPFWFPPGGQAPRGMPPIAPAFPMMTHAMMSSGESEEETEVVKKPRQKRAPRAKKVKADGGSDDEGGAQKRGLQSETEGQSEAEGLTGGVPGQAKPRKKYKKRRVAPPLAEYDQAKEKEIAELENDSSTVRLNKSEPELAGPVWEYLAALRRDLAHQVRDKMGPLYNKLKAGQLWVEPPPLPALPPTDMACTPDLFYLPRVLLWLPEVVWGMSPYCPKCFGGGTAEQPIKSMIPKGFPNAMARRVVALDHCYYVMTRKYECDKCSQSVRATDPNLVAQFPAYISGAFPAVINVRGGLDRSVVYLIEQADREKRSLVGVAEMVRNLQYDRYRAVRARYCSLVALQRKTLPAEVWEDGGDGGEDGDDVVKKGGGEEQGGVVGQKPGPGRPAKTPRSEGYMLRRAPNNEFGFSTFNDPAGYAGCCPSVEYLRAVVETFTGPLGRPRVHPLPVELVGGPANGQQAEEVNQSDAEQQREGNETADEGNNTETEGPGGKRKPAGRRAETRCGQCGKTTCGGAEKSGICEVAFQPGQGLVPDGKSFKTEEEVLQYKVLLLQQQQLKLQIERLKKRGKKPPADGASAGAVGAGVGGDNTEGEGNGPAGIGGGEGGEGGNLGSRKKKKNKFIKESQSEVKRLQRQLGKLQETAALRKAREKEKERLELLAGMQREAQRLEEEAGRTADQTSSEKSRRKDDRQGLKWAETITPGPNYRPGTSKQGGDSDSSNFREMFSSGPPQWIFPPGMGAVPGPVPSGGAMYMVPTGGDNSACRVCHDPSCPGREPGADCLRVPLPLEGGRGKGKGEDWLAKMKKAGPGGLAGMFPGVPQFPGVPVGPAMKVDMPGPDGRTQPMIAVPVAVPAGTPIPPGMRPPPGFPFHHPHMTLSGRGKGKNKGRGGRASREEYAESEGERVSGQEEGEEE